MFAPTTRILLVDDMQMFRSMMRQELNSLGFPNLVEANDGDDALALINAAMLGGEPFGLVICDWTMPRVKGIDVLKRVRSQEWGKTLPFLMLTGEAEKSFIMEAIRAGVTQYMIKPFSHQTFKDKLQQTYSKANEVVSTPKIAN